MPEAARPAAPRLRFALSPEASRLLRARDRIRDYLTLHCSDQATIDDVVLAIEEACTNAIRHSGCLQDVEISLCFEGDVLQAVVKDQGRGFDIDAFDATVLPDVMSDHGRGLFLISRLSDEMELVLDGGLEVRMIKRAVARCEAPALEGGIGDLSHASRSSHRNVRLRAMLEEIEEAFIALDWEYRFVHLNEAALRLIGTPQGEIIGRRIDDLFPHLDRAAPGMALREAMELGLPATLEYRGPGGWAEARIYPTPTGISLFSHDINERKRKEQENTRLFEELAARERLNAAFNEIVLSLTTAHDPDEILTQAVARTGSALGAESATICTLEPESWVPSHLWQVSEEVLGVPIPRERVAYADIGVRTKGVVTVDDCESDPRVDLELQRSWNVRSVMMAPLLVRNEAVGGLFFNYHARQHSFTALEIDFVGKAAAVISGALENARSLEAELAAQRQVERERSFLGRLLEELPYPTSYIDQGLVYRRCNTASAAAVGLTPEQLIGRTVESVIGPDSDGIERLQSVLATGRPYSGTIQHTPPGSSRTLHYRVSYAPDRDEHGTVVGVLTDAVDVTELVEAQTTLHRQADEVARRARFAEALNRINHLVHSSLELDRVLQYSLDEAVSALRIDAGVIELREEGAWFVRSHCGPGPIEAGMRLTDAQSPIAVRALRSREALAVDDLSTEPAAGILGGQGCVLCVPLIVREEVVGALLFHGGDPRVFVTSEVDFARTLGATVSLALGNLQIYERESQAARLGTALTGGPLVRATRRLRARPWLVLLILLLVQSAYLVPLGAVGQTRDILGIPGSLLAATAVVAGALAGPLIGTLAAALGGGLFFVTVAQLGTRSSLVAVAISTVMWMGAGLLSGLLARGLREQAQRRLRASVALAKAEAARQEQLADLSNLQRVARTLQEHFLHPLPTIDGLELAALSLPAARDELIGGDFHDVFVLPDGMVCALIGDVMGKGIAAAGMTETVRSAVRTLALVSSSPEYILANVNRLLLHEGEHQQLVTVLLVMLDPESGRGVLASAGHPPAVYLCDLGRRLIEPDYGLPLGALDQSFAATGFALAPGEALVLYTDGLTEARRDGELFGEARLLRVLAAAQDRVPQHLLERLQEAVVDYAGELKDDMQILVLRRT